MTRLKISKDVLHRRIAAVDRKRRNRDFNREFAIVVASVNNRESKPNTLPSSTLRHPTRLRRKKEGRSFNLPRIQAKQRQNEGTITKMKIRGMLHGVRLLH